MEDKNCSTQAGFEAATLAYRAMLLPTEPPRLQPPTPQNFYLHLTSMSVTSV